MNSFPIFNWNSPFRTPSQKYLSNVQCSSEKDELMPFKRQLGLLEEIDSLTQSWRVAMTVSSSCFFS